MMKGVCNVIAGVLLTALMGCDPVGSHTAQFESIGNLGGGEPGWIQVDTAQARDAVHREGLRTVHQFDTIEKFVVFKPVKIIIVPQDQAPDVN